MLNPTGSATSSVTSLTISPANGIPDGTVINFRKYANTTANIVLIMTGKSFVPFNTTSGTGGTLLAPNNNSTSIIIYGGNAYQTYIGSTDYGLGINTVAGSITMNNDGTASYYCGNGATGKNLRMFGLSTTAYIDFYSTLRFRPVNSTGGVINANNDILIGADGSISSNSIICGTGLGQGYVDLLPGGSIIRSGFVEFKSNGGTRLAFVGYVPYTNATQTGSGNFLIQAENGTTGFEFNKPIILSGSGADSNISTNTTTLLYSTIPTFTSSQIGYIQYGTISTATVPINTFAIYSTINLTPGVWALSFNLCCTNSGNGTLLQLALGPSITTTFCVSSSYGASGFEVSSSLTYTVAYDTSFGIKAYARYKGSATTLTPVIANFSFYQAVRIA